MNRTEIDRDIVEDFATDPRGVVGSEEATPFMAAWDRGERWPWGFVAFRGCICKIAQDHGLTREETDALLDQVFERPPEDTK